MEKDKIFIKILTIILLVGFGFVGGVLFVKRNHIPLATAELLSKEYSDLAKEKNDLQEALTEAQGKFVQCVIFLNGVLEGRKGVKK